MSDHESEASEPSTAVVDHPVASTYTRVSVDVPAIDEMRAVRVELQLPSRLPVAAVTDLILRHLKRSPEDVQHLLRPRVWSLGEAGAPALGLAACLADAGILDGAYLELRDTAATDIGEPLPTPIQDLIEERSRDDVAAPWDRAGAQGVAALLGAAALMAAVVVAATLSLARSTAAVVGIGGVAAAAACLALSRRWPRHGPPAGSPIGATGLVLTAGALALAAWEAAGDLDPVPRLAVAVAAAALALALVMRTATVAVCAAVSATAAGASALLAGLNVAGASGAAVGACVAAAQVLLADPISARVSLFLTPWPADGAPRDVDLAGLDEAGQRAVHERELRTRMGRIWSRQHQVALALEVSAAAVMIAAAAFLARASGWYGPTIALVTSALLCARSMSARRGAEGAVLLGGGSVTFVVTVCGAADRVTASWLGVAVVLASAVVVVLLGRVGGADGRVDGDADLPASPSGGRRARVSRVLGVVCLIALVTLTVGQFGAYAHFWTVGRSL